MAIHIRGSLLPFIQSEAFDFDPQRGYIQRVEFKGLGRDQMIALQQDYVAAGISCRLSFQHGMSYLEIEDSTQSFTIDSWEIVGNDLSVDGFSHPTAIGIFGGNPDNWGSLREDLNADRKVSEFIADLTASGFGGSTATAGRFYAMNQSGQSDYRRAQYVLRHTTNVPNRWASNISDVGVEKIYDTSELLSEVQNSGLWNYPMPGRMGYKIAAIPSPTARANYQWGWLKGPSTETTAANNRINITTEYCLEQWSLDYYAAY